MRDLAARGNEKLLRTGSSSPGRFRAWANRSYPEGIRLQLCISTVRATLAVRRKPNPPGKAVERRTKWEHAPGRTRGSGKSREKLPNAGDVKNDTAGLWAKGNLRVKRRDPWPRANAPSEAAADPELNGEDAKKEVTGVSLPGSQAGGATTSRSELKSLTRNSVAERHWTALLRGR